MFDQSTLRANFNTKYMHVYIDSNASIALLGKMEFFLWQFHSSLALQY